MDYLNMINQSIHYIESHLFDDNLIEKLYKNVYVSQFHFHRIFHLVTKLTVGQYIKKRRFTEISKILVSSDETLLNIALHAGYNSHEAFTRAFKDYFGQTPSQYRKKPEKQTFLLVDPFLEEDVKFSFNQIRPPKIIFKDALTLYGIRGKSSLDASSIDGLWQQFRDKTHQSDTGEGYSVWLDSESTVKDLKDSKTYACFVGSSVERSMDKLMVPKGMYAEFIIQDDFSKIYFIYAYIYLEWLKKSAYEFSDDMILEYYDRAFDYNKGTGAMSILIPIKKKQ